MRDRSDASTRRLFACALILTSFVLPGLTIPTSASAATDRCGPTLVAGMSLCLTWAMKRSDYASLVEKARAGDDDAADTLGDFHSLSMRAEEQHLQWRWWRLAAHRGHCNAIVKMGGMSDHPKEARRWRAEAKRRRCGTSSFRINSDPSAN